MRPWQRQARPVHRVCGECELLWPLASLAGCLPPQPHTEPAWHTTKEGKTLLCQAGTGATHPLCGVVIPCPTAAAAGAGVCVYVPLLLHLFCGARPGVCGCGGCGSTCNSSRKAAVSDLGAE